MWLLQVAFRTGVTGRQKEFHMQIMMTSNLRVHVHVPTYHDC